MSKADKKGRYHLHIELTPEQYQLLMEKAAQCSLSKRALVIRLLEGRARISLPSSSRITHARLVRPHCLAFSVSSRYCAGVSSMCR